MAEYLTKQTSEFAYVKSNQKYTLSYGINGYADLFLMKNKEIAMDLGKFKISRGDISIPDMGDGYFEVMVIYFKEIVCLHRYGELRSAKDENKKDFVFKICMDCGYVKKYSAKKVSIRYNNR